MIEPARRYNITIKPSARKELQKLPANLSIYNIAGQKVTELFDGIANANKVNVFTFNASDMSSGIYFCRLTTSEGVKNRKLIYLK